MNANELWAGTDYAWIPGRGRAQRFSYHAKRVKVISLKKIREYGNERKSTLVTFEVLDMEGNSLPEPTHNTVPAREVVGFWDDYYGEHEELIVGRIKEEQERLTKERVRLVAKTRLSNILSNRLGVAVGDINIDEYQVRIHRVTLEKALGIDREKLLEEVGRG